MNGKHATGRWSPVPRRRYQPFSESTENSRQSRGECHPLLLDQRAVCNGANIPVIEKILKNQNNTNS
jgi:hypothetical protein